MSSFFSSILSIFRGFVSPFATLIAVALVPFGGFVSMRSLGETDHGACLEIGTFDFLLRNRTSAVTKTQHSVAGRAAQCIIGLLIPASNSNHIIANLLLGCVVESGASQASQQIGDLKTAYMTRTAPRNIFYSQIIRVGSFAGTLIATLVYKSTRLSKRYQTKNLEYRKPTCGLSLRGSSINKAYYLREP